MATKNKINKKLWLLEDKEDQIGRPKNFLKLLHPTAYMNGKQSIHSSKETTFALSFPMVPPWYMSAPKVM